MQKVIYIDAANIILSAKSIGLDLDILKLLTKLRDKYRPGHLVYFTGNFKSMQDLFKTIELTGVEMVYKEIYNENNKQKANCDVEISHRITKDVILGKVNSLVLCSGDGDFAHILDFAANKNVAVKVIAADPASCSRVIKRRDFTKLSYLTDFGPDILK